ncbi:MAG: hypothetical protein ACR2LL_01290 [Nitrosopumilus sp.]
MSQSNKYLLYSRNDQHFFPSKNIRYGILTIIIILNVFFLISQVDIESITVSAENSDLSDNEFLRQDFTKGKIQWLETNYPEMGTGIVRVIDPDMNTNSDEIDFFDIDVWSDSDTKGIHLTVTESGINTGTFEGAVFFSTMSESSGHRLKVASGDILTAQYIDKILPESDIITTPEDEFVLSATATIGNIIDPCFLQRCSYSLEVVDAFGNSLSNVSVNQQIQITTDLGNRQDKDQTFVYFVQIQNSEGMVVYLDWISGSLSPGQSFSPAISWTPQEAGTFTATAFVWDSIENPTPLRHQVSTTIDVAAETNDTDM